MSVTFTTTVFQPEGANVTGLPIPDDAVSSLGPTKNPAVTVTVHVAPAPYSYASTVATRYGGFIVSLSSANRAASGLAAGDTVEVTLTLDDKPREMVVPGDLADALSAAGLTEAFGALSFSKQRGFIDPLDGAKTPETRIRRIEKTISTLSAS